MLSTCPGRWAALAAAGSVAAACWSSTIAATAAEVAPPDPVVSAAGPESGCSLRYRKARAGTHPRIAATAGRAREPAVRSDDRLRQRPAALVLTALERRPRPQDGGVPRAAAACLLPPQAAKRGPLRAPRRPIPARAANHRGQRASGQRARAATHGSRDRVPRDLSRALAAERRPARHRIRDPGDRSRHRPRAVPMAFARSCTALRELRAAAVGRQPLGLLPRELDRGEIGRAHV